MAPGSCRDESVPGHDPATTPNPDSDPSHDPVTAPRHDGVTVKGPMQGLTPACSV